MQYALIDNGKLILSGQKGKDNLKGEQSLTKDTQYGIGSVSKVYTAAAMMKLVDEGKVDLDTPVVNYLPDFKMKDERYKRITPRMLLNHSSYFYKELCIVMQFYLKIMIPMSMIPCYSSCQTRA